MKIFTLKSKSKNKQKLTKKHNKLLKKIFYFLCLNKNFKLKQRKH